jgi:excisionase family DNA binding protein
MTDLNTKQVAERLGCSVDKVRSLARQHGIGIFIGGKAGYRFSEDEYQQLRDSMRVLPPPRKRGRRRIA